ncbi:MAG: hypothetical protein HQ582_11535 [Planctomycetes bacterium]|nr:hypothetical protein [Planctomycetota bacterium]
MKRTVLILAAFAGLSLLPWQATPCRASAGEDLVPRRSTTFNYYEDTRPSNGAYVPDSGTEEDGRVGDLKTATQQKPVDGRWKTVGTTYYRYYADKSRQRRIKYVLEPDAYGRLKNDPQVNDPQTASEEKVAEYATRYFEYDEKGQVISEVSQEPAAPNYERQPEMPAAEHEDSSHEAGRSTEEHEERHRPAVPAQPTRSAPEELSDEPAESSLPETDVETKVCDRCGKPVSHPLEPGDRCPHCGEAPGSEESADRETVDAAGSGISRCWYTIGAAAVVVVLLGFAIALLAKRPGS